MSRHQLVLIKCDHKALDGDRITTCDATVLGDVGEDYETLKVCASLLGWTFPDHDQVNSVNHLCPEHS